MGLEIPETPDVPDKAGPLLDLFYRLSRRRPEGFGGPLPIPFQEIDAWSRLAEQRLGQHSLDVLLALDDAWMDELSRVRKAHEDREGTK